MRSYSDRSRSLDYRECPRSRWYGYEAPNGTGITGVKPTRVNMDLLVGGGFHEGVNHLLTGVEVDEAVGRALEGHGPWKGYWPVVKSQGLALETNEDASYVYYEQAALIEALIRGYNYFALPELLERFEVVEAERDEYAIFTLPGRHVDFKFVPSYDEPPFELIWGMRGDALLMDKSTLGLEILSLKTKKVWKAVHDEEMNRRDMQGMSEIATVEQRLGRWNKTLQEIEAKFKDKLVPGHEVLNIPAWFVNRFIAGASPIIDAVKMEIALKGMRKEYPQGSGRYSYSNPLIRPYHKSEDLSPVRKSKNASRLAGLPYALRWEFQDELGGNHTLGKGWRTVNIWEDMGVKEWMGILWNESIQGFDPGHGIKQQFVMPMEYYRSEEDIDRWKRSILYQEREVATGRGEVLASMGTPEFEDKLDQYFPMHADYPTDCYYCQFKGVCYGSKSYMHNPMSSMLFEPRTPNHKIEESFVQIKSSV